MEKKVAKSYAFVRDKLSKVYSLIRKQLNTKFGFDRDLYLVYTMSKVGSSSVYYSLKNKFPYKEIHHIHFLGETWLSSFKTGHSIFNNNIRNGEALLKLLHKKRWKIKIISLTRDPIARDISGIFQTWQHLFNVQDVTELSPEKIIEYLKKEDFSYSQNWFETDFFEFTGFDVFRHKFNKNRGYDIYSCNKADILILQLEQINSVFNQAMNEFIGKGNYILLEENITSSRASGNLNSAVKKQLKLPADQLENVYSTPYTLHFYNEYQIDKFKERWMER